MSTQTHILHVDDDEIQREYIAYTFARSGYGFEVEGVTTLVEAIERIKTGRYNGVILDLGLPDSHGVETVVRLREIDPYIPILVLTAVNDPNMADECIRAGANGLIVKGTDFHSILQGLILAIEDRQRRAEIDAEAARMSGLKVAGIVEKLRGQIDKLRGLEARLGALDARGDA